MAVSLHDSRSMVFSKGIGVATGQAMTAAEAIHAGGLDWDVAVVKAGYQVKGGIYAGSKIGERAIVKLDADGKAERDFGYVKGRYVAIQNREMFEFCDLLVDDYGAKYEAAWSLYDGRQVGLTMRFPETIQIGGFDPYDLYLLVSGRHDGTGSVKVATTMVRLYCTNMLNVALKGAEQTVRIAHVGSVASKIQAARETIGLTFKYSEEFELEMQALMAREMSDETGRAIISDLLAAAKYGGLEDKVQMISDLQSGSCTIHDEVRGTAYGWLQAATEWADWHRVAKTAHSNAVDMLDGRVVKFKNHLLSELLEV